MSVPESGHGDFSHLRGRPAKGAGGSVVPHTLAELFPFRSVVPMLTPGGGIQKKRQPLGCCRDCKRRLRNGSPIAAHFARNARTHWFQKLSSKGARLLR